MSGELTLEDVLPFGIESVRIDKHELPAVVVRKRRKSVLVWIDDLPTADAPDFEIGVDSRVVRMHEGVAEVLTEGNPFHKRLFVRLSRSPA